MAKKAYLTDGAIWGCGVNCGFKAFDKSFPTKEDNGNWIHYCPRCGQDGRNLVELMPLGYAKSILAVWDEVEA